MQNKNKLVVIITAIIFALIFCLTPLFAFAGTDQHGGEGGGGVGGAPWTKEDVAALCNSITWWPYYGGNDVGLQESPLGAYIHCDCGPMWALCGNRIN